MNKFDNLSEQELIEMLNQGNTSEEDLILLTQAMKAKGLKGIISEIDPEDPESQEMIEYIHFHQKLPKDYQSKTQIEKSQKILAKNHAESKDVDRLKTAIMILGHSGDLKSLEILRQYAKNPYSRLGVWTRMAIDECQTFLESDLLDRPQVKLFPAKSRITAKQILEQRKEIEQELIDLLKEHQSPFDLDYIKNIIYNEEDRDDMMKVVAVFDRGKPDELSNILELATDAWNYFPHKILNGRCPVEMLQQL